MPNKDDIELQEILVSEKEDGRKRKYSDCAVATIGQPEAPEDQKKGDKYQWAACGNGVYAPCGSTCSKLPPGYYFFNVGNEGLFANAISIKTEGLIRFPQLNSDKVIEEIQKFWTLEEKFKKANLAYKRGILLWGPQGSGKSSTINFLLHDVINRGGIAIKFNRPEILEFALKTINQIQYGTPIIVILEDLDEIIRHCDESEFLNLLDGITALHKVVFLATTNHPEKLGARIVNRPSRFDKRFKIGHPNPESRKMYFEHLLKDRVGEVDLNRWVEDTDGFSFAHLRELYVAVTILGDNYDDCLHTLSTMRDKPIADEDESFAERKVGFGNPCSVRSSSSSKSSSSRS